ncbi:MAG: class B sortase [Oscillospiraceae bacterium]|nr:class B sortase [Oscillospiraceae bacterium]
MYKILKAFDRVTDIVILVICLLLILFGAYALYDNQYVYSTASDRSALMYRPKTSGEDAGKWDKGELVDDVVAWLRIDDTTIDYPVVQGEDNQEYLNKDPFGEFSLSGSIFLDSRCDPDFSDHYSLVYGHHMARGIMFGALDDFTDRDFFAAHRRGELVTDTGRYDVTLFAVMSTLTTDGIVFMDDEDCAQRIDKHIRENADIYEEPEPGNIICLSTCSDSDSMQRLAVFGVLRQTAQIREGDVET